MSKSGSRSVFFGSILLILACTPIGISDESFPNKCQARIQGKVHQLRRTGIAVRYKSVVKVYVVSSFLAEGVKAADAKDLLASNDVKQLHLHFLLTVPAPDMAKGFCDALRANHPEPAFNAEVAKLLDWLEKASVKRGENLILTHAPKVGLICKSPRCEGMVIENPLFARAVWENYLGKINCSEDVKEGLISELR